MDEKELIDKINAVEDTTDKQELRKELTNIFKGMKKAAEGFLEIAQAANRMKEKKLYKHLGFETFDHFCDKIIGLTRKQVSLYQRIALLTEEYPDIFDERFVLSMGPTKMDEISKGINVIESSIQKKKDRRRMIEEMVSQVNKDHTVAETERIVKSFVRGLR